MAEHVTVVGGYVIARASMVDVQQFRGAMVHPGQHFSLPGQLPSRQTSELQTSRIGFG